MDIARQAILAARFRELHRAPPILVLPNAWDGASARVFELAGFTAIATTSAGVAASLGYPDGQAAPFDEVLGAVERIVAAVAVPVSVDFEAGYGNTPEDVETNCRAVIGAGAVGVNIEDGTGNPDKPLLDVALQVEKLTAARAAGSAIGVPLVINARTDVFLDKVGPEPSRLPQAIQRLNAYRAARADCLFAPGVTDRETLAELARQVQGPLNILAGPGTPPIHELAAIGIARVSFGSGPMRAALALTRRMAREWREQGTYLSLTQDAIPYAEVNEMFSARMAPPREPEQQNPHTTAREIVRRFYEEIWNQQDLSAISRLCHEGFEFRGSLGAERVGHEGFAEYVRSITHALGNYHCEIQALVVEGDRAFAKMLFSGVHRGALLDFPPTNRRVRWAGAALFTMEREKIRSLWVLGDVHGLVTQLAAGDA